MASNVRARHPLGWEAGNVVSWMRRKKRERKRKDSCHVQRDGKRTNENRTARTALGVTQYEIMVSVGSIKPRQNGLSWKKVVCKEWTERDTTEIRMRLKGNGRGADDAAVQRRPQVASSEERLQQQQRTNQVREVLAALRT